MYKIYLKSYFLAIYTFLLFISKHYSYKNHRIIYLFAIASLRLAEKLLSNNPISIDDYIIASNNNFSFNQIDEAETYFYKQLNCNIMISTVYDFYELYSKDYDKKINDMALSLLLILTSTELVFSNTAYVLTLLSYQMAIIHFEKTPPSTINYKILNIISILDNYLRNENYFLQTFHKMTNITLEELLDSITEKFSNIAP